MDEILPRCVTDHVDTRLVTCDDFFFKWWLQLFSLVGYGYGVLFLEKKVMVF